MPTGVYIRTEEIRKKFKKPYSEKYKNSQSFISRNKKISEARKKLFQIDEYAMMHRELKVGTKCSEIKRKRISEAQKDKKKVPFSEDHKQHISDALKGNKIAYGKRWKMSEEAKIKLKERMKNIMSNPEIIDKIRKARANQILPRKDTKIEIILQEFLINEGIPFIKHKSILGQPDIFIEPNICIFADGCYWHGCEKCIDRNKLPSWIRGTKVHDLCITQKLQNDGYAVLRFWEHEIYGNLDEIKQIIRESIPIKIK